MAANSFRGKQHLNRMMRDSFGCRHGCPERAWRARTQCWARSLRYSTSGRFSRGNSLRFGRGEATDSSSSRTALRTANDGFTFDVDLGKPERFGSYLIVCARMSQAQPSRCRACPAPSPRFRNHSGEDWKSTQGLHPRVGQSRQ
jgi:hypothetical protein